MLFHAQKDEFETLNIQQQNNFFTLIKYIQYLDGVPIVLNLFDPLK